MLKLSVHTIKYCNKSLMTTRLRWAEKNIYSAEKDGQEIEMNM